MLPGRSELTTRSPPAANHARAGQIGTALTATSTFIPIECVRAADIPSRDGQRLRRGPRYADTDQVGAGDQPVRRIVFHPPCSRQIDVAPRVRAAAALCRSGRVIVEVSRDEASSDAKASQGLHHEHREIAACARSERNRLGGSLRAFFVPSPIAEVSLYGVRHRFQDGECPSLARVADKPPRPCIDRSIRIRQLSFGKSGEVGNLLRGIGERERLSARSRGCTRAREVHPDDGSNQESRRC